MRSPIFVGILIGAVILPLSAFGLFQIKYKVLDLKKDLAEINRQLEQEREAIHVLKAEWAYLNQPDRLRRLANKHLGLSPITVAQMRQEKEINLMLASDKRAMSREPKKMKVVDLEEFRINERKNLIKASIKVRR